MTRQQNLERRAQEFAVRHGIDLDPDKPQGIDPDKPQYTPASRRADVLYAIEQNLTHNPQLTPLDLRRIARATDKLIADAKAKAQSLRA